MIDVIIPYYNNRDGLFRCLGSLVCQNTSKPFTVTVVDDCSDESVDDIINLYKKYLDLNYYKLEYNHKYPGLVRQYGIDHTHNDLIMFLDSDDMFDNEAIQIAYCASSEVDI